jgi:chromosome segregation ATPase
MMQSPFSPFVHRRQTVKDFKRRQSELPSDLIDWDAPEIPELDKQRIIYEEYIKECNEDHAIEMLICEEVYQIAHEVFVETTLKQHEDKLLKERSQNNLLLGQHKLFEDHIQELESTIKELENQNKDLENQNNDLKSEKENIESKLKLSEQKLKESQELTRELEDRIKELESRAEDLDNQYKELDEQYKELEFRNKELEADISCQFEAFALKKAEALEFKRKWESAENKLSHLRKMAKETK